MAPSSPAAAPATPPSAPSSTLKNQALGSRKLRSGLSPWFYPPYRGAVSRNHRGGRLDYPPDGKKRDRNSFCSACLLLDHDCHSACPSAPPSRTGASILAAVRGAETR